MYRALGLCCLLGLALSATGSAAQAAEHTVRVISDHDNLRMYFDPKFLIIQPGDSVTWVNEFDEEHNVLSFPDGFPKGESFFISPLMKKKGDSWTRSFPQAGTYEYHCLPHLPMGMHGVIVAGQPSTNDQFHVPSAEEIAAYRQLMLTWFEEDEIEYPIPEDRDRAAQNSHGHQQTYQHQQTHQHQ